MLVVTNIHLTELKAHSIGEKPCMVLESLEISGASETMDLTSEFISATLLDRHNYLLYSKSYLQVSIAISSPQRSLSLQ